MTGGRKVVGAGGMWPVDWAGFSGLKIRLSLSEIEISRLVYFREIVGWEFINDLEIS